MSTVLSVMLAPASALDTAKMEVITHATSKAIVKMKIIAAGTR
jgi:hypothetical protein